MTSEQPSTANKRYKTPSCSQTSRTGSMSLGLLPHLWSPVLAATSIGQLPPQHEGSPGTRNVDHAPPIHQWIDLSRDRYGDAQMPWSAQGQRSLLSAAFCTSSG
jgi:hypothetical protein